MPAAAVTPGIALPPLPSASAPSRSSDPTTVADSFEALFLSQLLEPLADSEAFFGEGPAGRTFAGLFRQQLSDQLASSRPLGIADRIETVLRRQAVASYGKVHRDDLPTP